MIRKIIRGAKKMRQDPKKIVDYALLLGGRVLSDKLFLQIKWWGKTGRVLHLKKPQGFNEKLQWLKLYDRNPQYTELVDKYEVRNFIKQTLGEEYLIPLLGVWEKVQDIDFDKLPNQFVLKCTHNSGGGMVLCKDKNKLDISSVVKKLQESLDKNYYHLSREWPYKNIVPRIIAESFVTDKDPANTLGTLINYKFYCFNGEPKFLYVGADDISKGVKGESFLSVLDLNWKPTAFGRLDHKPLPSSVIKPPVFGQMIEIARKLAKNLPFVRVDLYYVNGQILFSEMTFYPGAGYGFFTPAEWENKIGNWLALPAETVK